MDFFGVKYLKKIEKGQILRVCNRKDQIWKILNFHNLFTKWHLEFGRYLLFDLFKAIMAKKTTIVA